MESMMFDNAKPSDWEEMAETLSSICEEMGLDFHKYSDKCYSVFHRYEDYMNDEDTPNLSMFSVFEIVKAELFMAINGK